jgi:hypothetical protein
VYLFSGLEIFDSSDRRPSDDDSSRRYVGAGGGAGLQREKVARLQGESSPATGGKLYWEVPLRMTTRQRDSLEPQPSRWEQSPALAPAP